MCLAISSPLTQTSDAPQIAHHILGLAKVDLLQQVAHLELHVLDQPSHVGDVTVVVLDGEILLHLACHVAAEIHVAQVARCRGQGQDHCRGELVVRGAAALDSLEDVDGIPDSLGTSARCRSFMDLVSIFPRQKSFE